MVADFRVDVEPDVLIWARQSRKLSQEAAAALLRVRPVDLMWWEAGVEGEGPTISELKRMAKVYKRPLVLFFLPRPPKDFMPVEDFRLLPENEGKAFSWELETAIERVRMQQEVAQDLADLENEVPEPIELSVSLEANPEAVGPTIREWLGKSVGNRTTAARQDALNEWIRLIEAKTVLVTQVVHVDLKEMRGCSLSEQPFPVIVLNSKDSRPGKVFTLLHELVHILVHAGGICDLERRKRGLGTSREQIERFCNRTAAATLMPRDQVLRDSQVASAASMTRWADDDLKRLADMFGVSREAMLFRLVELHRASRDFYFERRPHFLQMYDEAKRDPQERHSPGYYWQKVRDFGQRYVSTVLDAYYQNRITASDLSNYLEIKINHLPRLQAEVEKRQ